MKKNFFEKFSDHSKIFFYYPIYKKLNAQKKISGHFCLAKKQIGCLKKTSFENFIPVVLKGGFQFLWIMVLLGATFNAAIVICVVSLLLFRLPMAMLWQVTLINKNTVIKFKSDVIKFKSDVIKFKSNVRYSNFCT